MIVTHTWKTAKVIKSDIVHQHITCQCAAQSLFMIFLLFFSMYESLHVAVNNTVWMLNYTISGWLKTYGIKSFAAHCRKYAMTFSGTTGRAVQNFQKRLWT